MRPFFYALMAVLLLVLTVGFGWLWYDSAATASQMLIRSGGSRAVLVTVDRSRVSMLMGRGESLPLDVSVARMPVDTTVLLDEQCDDQMWGFGLDSLVRRDGLAPVEAKTILTGEESRKWKAWRMVMPMWAITAATAGLLVVWWLKFNVPLYRELGGRCRKCGYDVNSSSHFCPVCKQELPRRTWSGDVRPGGK
ncbi:MAG: hypothetical protein V3V20_10375 [Algisphaera sp.]